MRSSSFCSVRSEERGKAAGGCAPALVCCGRPGGPTPLRCSAAWPAEKLASLTAFAALEQSRRVRNGSARCARAATSPALLSATQCRGRRTPAHGFASATEFFAENHERLSAVGGARGGRLVGRREAQRRGRRAY